MKLKPLTSEEDGLVSIIVTMIIMSLLTLMAIGFSNIANREQRQALDQQLNTQSFYAAESGINEAIHTGLVPNSNCAVNNLGTDASVSTSCLLINPEPASLEYSSIDPNGSVVIPIKPTNGDLSSITISWQNKDGSTRFSALGNHALTDKNSWLSYPPDNKTLTGLLRVMLMPSSFNDRTDLINKTHNFLLYPNNGNGTPGSASPGANFTQEGAFINGNCNELNHSGYDYFCNATINISVPQGSMYLLRLAAIYAPVSVTVTGEGPSGRVKFSDAQTEIDSTGRTTDVLKRLKVKVPSNGNKWAGKIFPEFAVETTDTLCKRLKVWPARNGALGNAETDIVSGDDADACSPTP